MKLLLGNENVLKELQDCRRGYYAAIFAFWLYIKIIVTRHFFYKKTFMIKVIQNFMEITLCFHIEETTSYDNKDEFNQDDNENNK